MSGGPTNRFREFFARGPGRPMVLAHRGDSFHAPENTLLAAALGHRSGADGWEFDVQLTGDGSPILLHDPSLLRTTDVARKFPDDPRADLGYLVAEFTLDEIRRLDAGSWFLDPSGGPRSARGFGTIARLDPEARARITAGLVGVPTLEEALRWTAGLDWLANVEIKSAHDGDFRLADEVVRVIRALDAADRVLVSSFDHAEVARVARSGIGLATGVLATTPLHEPIHYIGEVIGADAYHISALALGAGGVAYRRGRAPGRLRADDLDECRRAGLPVLVFTVNEAGPGKLAGHLAEAGVAGLFTDDPNDLADQFIPSSEHTRRHWDGTGRRSVDPSGRPTDPASR